MLQIKLNNQRRADWHYYEGTDESLKLETGKSLYHKYNHKYGYRIRLIELDGKYYVTMALYESPSDYESISVHLVKSPSDAMAMINVMTQVIKNKGHRSYVSKNPVA